MNGPSDSPQLHEADNGVEQLESVYKYRMQDTNKCFEGFNVCPKGILGDTIQKQLADKQTKKDIFKPSIYPLVQDSILKTYA